MTAEQRFITKSAENKKHSKKRFLSTFTIIFVLILGLIFWRILFYKSVDERIAAIEASMAIPDSENAAILYNELIKDYGRSDLSPSSIDPNDIARNEFWLSSDYPELAKWFEEMQEIITKLLQILEFEYCRFPIQNSSNYITATMDRLSKMRQWAYFLVRSANNDIAEGRIDQALDKYFCLIRMGRHNRQHPVTVNFLTGIAIESLALQRMRFCILQSDLTEDQLSRIESALPQSEEQWKQQWDNMLEVENLYTKNTSVLYRFQVFLQNLKLQRSSYDRIAENNIRFLTLRRGNQILVGLRRYKDKHGHWPENLEAIESLIPAEALLDPAGGKFEYKNQGKDFTLSGKLQNIWPQ